MSSIRGNTCIYCHNPGPFTRREHVFTKGIFGVFQPATPTFSEQDEMVCDVCNEYFNKSFEGPESLRWASILSHVAATRTTTEKKTKISKDLFAIPEAPGILGEAVFAINFSNLSPVTPPQIFMGLKRQRKVFSNVNELLGYLRQKRNSGMRFDVLFSDAYEGADWLRRNIATLVKHPGTFSKIYPPTSGIMEFEANMTSTLAKCFMKSAFNLAAYWRGRALVESDGFDACRACVRFERDEYLERHLRLGRPKSPKQFHLVTLIQDGRELVANIDFFGHVIFSIKLGTTRLVYRYKQTAVLDPVNKRFGTVSPLSGKTIKWKE